MGAPSTGPHNGRILLAKSPHELAACWGMLRLGDSQAVPPETARVARAAFPKGNPDLTLRDELGSVFQDEDFEDLYPRLGQPALPPWRLALVTLV